MHSFIVETRIVKKVYVLILILGMNLQAKENSLWTLSVFLPLSSHYIFSKPIQDNFCHP